MYGISFHLSEVLLVRELRENICMDKRNLRWDREEQERKREGKETGLYKRKKLG